LHYLQDLQSAEQRSLRCAENISSRLGLIGDLFTVLR
jgi:hypothetical protein